MIDFLWNNFASIEKISIVHLFLFIFSVIGLTNVLIQGKIFDDNHLGLRKFLKGTPEKLNQDGSVLEAKTDGFLGKYSDVLDCYECTGFWSGLFFGLVLISFNPFILLVCGFAGSFISQFYYDLINLIISKTDFLLEQHK